MATPKNPHMNVVRHPLSLFAAIKGVAAIAASAGVCPGRPLSLEPAGPIPPLALGRYRTACQHRRAPSRALVVGLRPNPFDQGLRGVWKDRARAGWLAALSGAVYLPTELSHLIGSAAPVNAAVLASNVAVLAHTVIRLLRRRAQRAAVLEGQTVRNGPKRF